MIMDDKTFMKRAIELAKSAALHTDVPVGAVVVRDDVIIACGENKREQCSNALLHAEVDAITNACAVLNNKNLQGCTLYVTLEPCAMCAGAIINSRIDRVVFGTYDERFGATGSVCNLFEMPFNHHPLLTGGVLEKECRQLLKDFFKDKRLS